MWKISALRRVQSLKTRHYIRKKLHKKTARRIIDAITVDNPVGLAMMAFDDDDQMLAENLELLFSDDKDGHDDDDGMMNL